MGFYRRIVLPPLLHRAMRLPMLLPYRQRIVGAAEGRVLEIGVGSGLNLGLYGDKVSTVIGLDPAPELLRLARRQRNPAGVAIDLMEATAEALPIEDASVDTVVTTWTLCTIPDAGGALRECRRVLRPGGSLLFVEHGRAPEAAVARWQDRLDPLWSRLAGGCHLNRKIDALIAGAGFRIEAMRNSRIRGLPTHNFFYEGRARGA
jgi:ubiquinone/menaquinone biosynthesis C-methylase UbiE